MMPSMDQLLPHAHRATWPIMATEAQGPAVREWPVVMEGPIRALPRLAPAPTAEPASQVAVITTG